MKKAFAFLLLAFCIKASSQAQAVKSELADSLFPVRGFCIAAPNPNVLDEFIKFVDKELAPRSVNTLILRVDYNYQYESHPELRDSGALSKNDVKKIVAVCRKHNIRVIPQVNLLGHQSWAGRLEKLLLVYPEFDETPYVKMPEKYIWPNSDGLYCKSYCPLHPGVHKIVFELVDEICDAFEANAFHAGMDEVFYLGDSQCPRCSGHDKAELFAGEVRKIRDHLSLKDRRLWIWGDRLIDGKTTGIGMWSASMNNTHRAIDMIPKDVMICDWHYNRPEPTAVLFAMKGLDVVECPYQVSSVGIAQVQDMARFRQTSSPAMAKHFKGVVQTVWSGASPFLDRYYGRVTEDPLKSAGNCFKATFEEIQKITSK